MTFLFFNYHIKRCVLFDKKHYYRSMKKFFIGIFILLLSANNFVMADADLWDNYGDQNTYGQQAVTDQDFQKALDSKKGKKKKDKNIPKGESFSQSNETEALSSTAKELPVLLIPLNLKVGDGIIPIGHYQVEGTKEGSQTFLKLYQGYTIIAKLPAEETNDDFGEQSINFVKLIPHGNYHVQIIYGSIDFNAYSIIDIAE